MSKELIAIIVGAILCVGGALLVHFGFPVPGFVVLGLGILGVMAGPMAVNL